MLNGNGRQPVERKGDGRICGLLSVRDGLVGRVAILETCWPTLSAWDDWALSCLISRGEQAKTAQAMASELRMVIVVSPPNGSRLSCGRLARWRKSAGRSPCPARGTTLRFLWSDHRPPASSAC